MTKKLTRVGRAELAIAAAAVKKSLTKTGTKKKPSANFTKRVQSAALEADPMQYRLYGVDQIAVGQAPVVLMNLSNVKANNTVTNDMYLRSSRRIRPNNITLRFRIDAQDTPNNTICIALVRHKRSEEITTAMIQNAAGIKPEFGQNDSVFFPLDNGKNTNVTNMTGISVDAHPSMVLDYFNPKVVDVEKTWVFNVQPTTQATPSNWRNFNEKSYFHKFKGEWKYPEMRQVALPAVNTDFPYNNRCYSLLAWSDSVTGSAHPKVSVSARFSFKDLD